MIAPKPHRTISHPSATPASRSNTLPHHSFSSPSTTIHQRTENQSNSKTPYQHADFTASLPHNFKSESCVEHPVSNRHSKNASTNLNHNSPPKVNYM